MNQPEFVFSSGGSAPVVLSGEFNGDGKLDLATLSYQSPVWVLLNTTK